MKVGQKKLLLLVLVLGTGISLGYFIGYDHGFEKAVSQNKETLVFCDTEAQKKAREDLKPKYGDPVSMELLLSSPYYKEQYSQCLSEKGLQE